MRSLIATLSSALIAVSLTPASAQDRFVWRPNNTAIRQNIPARSPNYQQYYEQRYNQNRYNFDRNNAYRENAYRYNAAPRYDYRAPPAASYRSNYRGAQQDELRPVYQFYNPDSGDQLLSIQPEAESYDAMGQYISEGMTFYVWPTSRGGLIPLYRLVDARGIHSYTTGQRPQGGRLEHVVGYMQPKQTAGTVPLYGFFDGYTNQYIVSIQPRPDLQQTTDYLGVLGYVMPG